MNKSNQGSYLPIELKKYNELFPKIVQAHRLIVEYDVKLESSNIKDFFIQVQNLREALYSTRLDGTKTTFEKYFKDYLNKKKNINNNELQNYINILLESKKIIKTVSISSKYFCLLHEKLLKGAKREINSIPGEYRKIQNWVGIDNDVQSSSFVPPKILDLISNLQKYINDFLPQDDNYDILVRCAIIHAQFENIHPFLEGNGRINRLLIPSYIYSKKVTNELLLFLSPIFEKNKLKYNKYLTQTQNGNWNQWVDFFIECIIEQIKDNIQTLNKLELFYSQRKEHILSKFNQDTFDIYCIFLKIPIISIKDIKKLTNFSYYKIRREIIKLLDEKIIVKGNQKRNIKYSCNGVLDIISN